MMRRTTVLYISYDGMLEPLGQSQVVSYLNVLSDEFDLVLVSFEKEKDWLDRSKMESARKAFKKHGIRWHPLRYHKKPTLAATSFDVMNGIRLCRTLIRKYGVQLVHARSYVACTIAEALRASGSVGYVFDMRGLWADERVDGGLWPKGGLYKVAKSLERRFFSESEHVVSLTNAGVETIRELADGPVSVSVIPTCVDLERFRKSPKRRDPLTVAYVGSTGTWYNFEAVVSAMRSILDRRPDARLRVLNRGQHDYIWSVLEAANVPPDSVVVKAVSHADVPAELAGVGLGVFFYRRSPSRVACSPTKLGEFLGCGIPCLTNSGVGDVASFIREDQVGVAIDSFSDDSIEDGVDRVLEMIDEPGIRDRCRASAEKRYSLLEGAAEYARIYRRYA